jgi:CubicO group peptidase (beta-lactamase class C family)
VNKHLYVSVIIIMLLFWLLTPMSSSLAAQLQTQEQSRSLQSRDDSMDPVELQAFLDQLMQEQMEENHIAGAVVSVVKDGEMTFARGYGLADEAGNKPVDPETTLFNIGSIGKVFTFTAAMQLVEQGKLDLNADINTYLDFKIPATYPEPITMAHLMSHSAGLDEFYFGTSSPTAEKVLPLGEYLRTHLPPRVRPPGVVSAYTAYGVALAGYIVERVSGQPYAAFIEEHILKPLGMAHTSPWMPLPESLSRDMSLTYVYSDGTFHSVEDPFRFVNLAPAGSIKSTAADMARFMIAHLQEGAYQDARILETETARLMHRQSFTQDPRLKGWAHGFEELRAENPRVIGHNGDTYHFHTQMYLVPEANLGLFVANNSANGRKMVDYVAEAFVDHYFPPPAVTSLIPLENSNTDLRALEGSYASANASYGTSEKVRLVLSILKIQAQDDGSLLLSSLAGSQRYVEVESLLFQRDDGKRVDYLDHFTFIASPDGKTQYLLADSIAFQKMPWYETMGFNILFSAIVLLLFLSVPIAAIVVRLSTRLGEQAARQPRDARLARWLLGLVVVLFFISLGGMFSAFASEAAVLTGTAVAYKVGIFLAIPVAILAVGAVVFTVLAWRRAFWSLGWRIHYSLVTLGAIAVVWWYFNWKIIG